MSDFSPPSARRMRSRFVAQRFREPDEAQRWSVGLSGDTFVGDRVDDKKRFAEPMYETSGRLTKLGTMTTRSTSGANSTPLVAAGMNWSIGSARMSWRLTSASRSRIGTIVSDGFQTRSAHSSSTSLSSALNASGLSARQSRKVVGPTSYRILQLQEPPGSASSPIAARITVGGVIRRASRENWTRWRRISSGSVARRWSRNAAMVRGAGVS